MYASVGRDDSICFDGELDDDALNKELERILEESIGDALEEQERGFERKYSQLLDSRSFWRRVAVGEGGAIAAALLGAFLFWNLSR